jgi:N-methylhydantoinase A/oxoprolinase/acetone carboxylase beta subunit
VEGAAVIEQFDSTTVVSPGMSARVDKHGNLILEAR